MKQELIHVRRAIYGTPWLLKDADTLDAYAEIFERAQDGLAAQQFERRELADDEPEIIDGVAVIPVVGPIARRMNLFSQISGGTSVEQLDRQFSLAMASDAPTVLFRFDSPGGTVNGIFELAEKIADARDNSDKFIIALAEGQCCSAAYLLASQSNEIVATVGSEVGSIGVYAKISNADRAMKNQGVDSVVVRSGELKGIGADNITPNQMAALQGRVNELFEMFKEVVQAGRAGVNIEDAASGLSFLPARALELGLIDKVATFEEVLQERALF